MTKSLKEAWLPGLLILISPFIYTREILDPVMVPRILFYASFLIPASIIALFGVIKNRLQTRIISNNLVWFYLGYLIFTAISIILSINPGEGIWEFLRTSLFFFIFLVTTLLLQKETTLHKSMPVIMAVFSGLLLYHGIVQLVEVFKQGPPDHQSSYLINSVLAHRNLFADALFFTLAFLIMGVFFHKGLLRFSFIFLIALTLSMITLIMVRSIWLAVIASTMLVFAIILIYRKTLGISLTVFRRLMLWAFAGLIVVMVSLAIYSRFGNVRVFQQQTHVIRNVQYGSALERLQLWEKSWEMFKDSPIVGAGKGNWRIYLPDYGASGMRSAEGEIVYQRPHNDFLWVLAESGVFAFISYLLMFITALFYLVQIIRQSPDVNDKYVAIFLLFFLSGYLIIASLSFPMERPIHSLLLSFVFAITVIKYQKLRKDEKTTPKKISIYFAGLLIIGLLSATIYAGYHRYTGESHTRQLMLDRINNRWHKVIDESEKAESFFMKLDPTATPLRWYSGLAWYNLGEMKNALADFEKAYRVHPYHMHVLNNLATIIGKNGNTERAKKLYKESMRISPEFKDAALNLCVIYYNSGRLDSAYRVLRNVTAANKNPNYRNVVTAIVFDKVEALKKNVDDRDLLVTLTRIRNSDDWMVKVHEQAVNDKIPLDRHLIIESIYMLETVDKTIDKTRADFLREKYLSNS